MKKQDLQNERLDGVGHRLLDTARMPSEEIDKIIAAPHLFESVKTRIEAEKRRREARGFFSIWNGYPVWNWQRAGIAFGALAALLIGIAGVANFTRQNSSDVALNTQPIDPKADVSIQPKIIDNLPAIAETESFTENSPTQVRRIVSSDKRAINSLAAKRRARPEDEEVGEFYALTYTDDPETNDDGGQIVRVELPRSSLLAMGVDVPSDNGLDKVKTDLLIGSDGVMKAVRLVK